MARSALSVKEGRDNLLTCNKDIGSVLQQGCVNDADDDELGQKELYSRKF